MTSPCTIAARIRLALVCAALAAGGGALPARALAPAPPVTEVVLVLERRASAPRPQRTRALTLQAVPSASPRRCTLGVTAPPPGSGHAPRLYVLHRALLR